MTCEQIADFLHDFVSGELPQQARSAFESHLAVCPDCRRYLDSYRKTIALGRGAFDPATQVAAMPESLVTAILHATGQK